jgi:pimeloyl-ACP methyl ester carboxylesterase
MSARASAISVRPRRWAAPLLVAGAAAIAAALVVQNRSRRAEREHPPTGSFVEIDGVRLHYVERGEGAPLVLLHGLGTMSSDFLLSDLVEMAARKYRVIVFDRPGYGHSERPRLGTAWDPQAQARLLHGALQRIGADRAIILGHSWASLIAISMALQHPLAVRSLVLEAGYCYPTLRPDMLLLAPPAIPVVGDFLRYTFAPLLLRAFWPWFVRRMFAPARVPASFWRFPVWMTARPSQLRATAAESVEALAAAAMLSRRYREIRVPVVVVAGAGDAIVDPFAHSERLHGDIRPSEFRLVPRMGHMLHHLVPERVLEAIDAAAGLGKAAPIRMLRRVPAYGPSDLA